MAFSSSSAPAADARTLEQLHKENADLKKEIDAIRASLGLDAKEAAEEKARVLAVFKKYDTDNSGTIDRKEFDAVAFDAGYDPAGLDEKGVTKIFEEMKPKTPTAVTFDEFFRWFKATSSSKTQSRTYQLGHAVRLQAKSFGKTIEGGRGALKSAKARLALPRAVGVAARPEIKSAFTETREGIRVKLQVGDFSDVGVGVSFHTKSDHEGLATLLAQVGVPEGKNTFGFIDFGVSPTADEGQLGELAGIIDGMFGMLGGGLNEKAGVPVYHSHTVKPTKDKDGHSVLRAAFFADMNPLDLAAAATGAHPSIFSPSGVVDLRVALETPLSLANLREPAFMLTPDQLRARFTIDGSISSSLDKRAIAVCTTLGLPAQAASAASMVNFFKGLNIDIQTVNLADFVKKFAGSERGIGAKINEAVAVASHTALNPVLKGMNIPAMLSGMAGPEMAPIIESATRNLTGPRRVHLQLNDVEFVLSFTGLDVFTLLGALAPGAE